SRWFLRFALLMGPAGLIAILAGWYTTEVGRQPWVVYGLMRTEDAVSTHSATTLGVSLALFVVVYLFVFGAGVAYTLRLVRKGPQLEEGARETSGGPGRPRHAMRPLSAVEEDLDDDQDTDGGR
ncbi:MAG TPA: cytochrome ubiquinol oxidase subunit I, partial [Alcanivorax sp.]|nr:cytochrome ubiquinol oxidase subunit I [Alcanivorax sp.]